jgi:hypothetical protein
VSIFGAAYLAEKIFQIVPFAEAGELRNVIQAHIEQASDSSVF